MREFNATERCDRCMAQAHYIATKPGNTDLLFCSHHYREHRDALTEQYWLIDSDLIPVEHVSTPTAVAE